MKSDRNLDIMIEPTNRCNLRCPTCFSHLDTREKDDMSLWEFKKIVDDNSSVIRNISLYNYGEPLLNKDIAGMIAYAKAKGAGFIKVCTNGMPLSTVTINKLLLSGLDYLSISLDGATEDVYKRFRIRGNFKRVISNIRNLVVLRGRAGSDLQIEIQFIIMKHNQRQLLQIEKLSRSLGVDYLRLKKVLIKRSEWDYLLPDLPQYNRYAGLEAVRGCFKPLKEIAINSDGTVIPCCYIVLDDIQKFSMGNIFKTSLKEIIRSNRYKEFIKKCSKRKSALSCCRDCREGNLKLDYKLIRLQ